MSAAGAVAPVSPPEEVRAPRRVEVLDVVVSPGILGVENLKVTSNTLNGHCNKKEEHPTAAADTQRAAAAINDSIPLTMI